MKVTLIGGTRDGKVVETDRTDYLTLRKLPEVPNELNNHTITLYENETYYIHKATDLQNSVSIGLPVHKTLAWALRKLIESYRPEKPEDEVR